MDANTSSNSEEASTRKAAATASNVKICRSRECSRRAGQVLHPRSPYCSRRCQTREQNWRQGKIKGSWICTKSRRRKPTSTPARSESTQSVGKKDSDQFQQQVQAIKQDLLRRQSEAEMPPVTHYVAPRGTVHYSNGERSPTSSYSHTSELRHFSEPFHSTSVNDRSNLNCPSGSRLLGSDSLSSSYNSAPALSFQYSPLSLASSSSAEESPRGFFDPHPQHSYQTQYRTRSVGLPQRNFDHLPIDATSVGSHPREYVPHYSTGAGVRSCASVATSPPKHFVADNVRFPSNSGHTDSFLIRSTAGSLELNPMGSTLSGVQFFDSEPLTNHLPRLFHTNTFSTRQSGAMLTSARSPSSSD